MIWIRAILFIAFLSALVLTVVVYREFERYDLRTESTPHGIIDFEFAATPERAKAMVEAWKKAGLTDNVRPNVVEIDSQFIWRYAAALILGCLWAKRSFCWTAGRFSKWWIGLGAALAVMSALAAALDFAENFAMMRTFDALEAGTDPRIWPAIATVCALPKFVFVIAGSLYILVGIVGIPLNWLSQLGRHLLNWLSQLGRHWLKRS
jgi:hypothetical protein